MTSPPFRTSVPGLRPKLHHGLRRAALALLFGLASANAQGQATTPAQVPVNPATTQEAAVKSSPQAPARPSLGKAPTPPNPIATATDARDKPASPGGLPSSASPPQAIVHHHHAHHHRISPQTSAEVLLQAANAQARAYPTPSAYLNATLNYDFEPGRLYQVETSPRFLTAIMLKPGEKLISKASGDTVRWVMGETAEGSGASARVIILIKPIEGGLRTNIVLSTDQRTYLIEASSREGTTYSSALTWNYPQDQLQNLAVAQARAPEAPVATGLRLDQLHFGYRIEPQHDRAPRWQPVRVFDDGLKTYIQFPDRIAATDAPPLFLVGDGGKAELVNYRYLDGYYVVDRLIDVAELRLGEKTQTVVRITRTRERS